MENGWTRVHSDMEPIHAYHSIYVAYSLATEWLSQANYIFSCLNITSNRQHAVFVNSIRYDITSQPGDSFPQGFLFLCPATDLLLDHSTGLQHLDSVAYWSLDPAGIDRLSAEDANDLGFPAIEVNMEVLGQSWDGSIYDGLREFHQAKGFNPDNQDVARHLGHPLFEVSPDVPPGFSFVNEPDGGRESDDEDSVALSHGKVAQT
ncbi:hypothetical protein GGX14DRAFT_427392 [Mycena pura]|uniref:Uncharacterized protein n=1 Tax=Mycena pura TaxID=153505 RepID=A0AAD6YM30_9AGAR|nr:hypothetical protein GGX14DRAFT_427392 [Mycena pura]